MSTFMLFALFISAVIFSLAILAISLWLLARLFRVPNVSIGRATATALFFAVANLATQGAYFGFSAGATPKAIVQTLAALVMLPLGLFVAYSIVKRMFRMNTGRAIALFITMLVANSICGFGGALAIRAKLCEAFVMPNGAQALTIYGKHFDVHCTNCGCRYAVSVFHDEEPSGHPRPIESTCPNCGQVNRITAGSIPAGGDHFIADKTTTAKRWDMVVFKSPAAPNVDYVKRIIALPHETIVFALGHVFINGREIHRPPDEETDLWIPVSDSRFSPTAPVSGGMHWQPADGSHWSNQAGRWSCEAAGADELQWNGTITNSLAYDEPFKPVISKPHPVGDLRLDCWIGEFSGSGSVGFHWGFAGKRFDVEVASTGEATLDVHPTGVGTSPSHAHCKLSMPISGGQQLTFAVRDGVGYFCENGKPLAFAAIDDDKFNAEDAATTAEEKPCQLSISAKRCKLKLSRIALARDTFYEPHSEEMTRPHGLVGLGPFQLGDDEYCVIGDNVSLSQDSRDFGPIKNSAIVGVARWIFWPPSRWHAFQ
jgi:hypothetical protein